MKKFGSNWKKLASNISNVRKQSGEQTDSISSSDGIGVKGKVSITKVLYTYITSNYNESIGFHYQLK